MRTLLRALAPLPFAAFAAAAHAQYSGGFGAIADTAQWSASYAPTSWQADGGKRHYEAATYGSTTYGHEYYGAGAGDSQAHASIFTGTIGCASSGNTDVAHAAPFGTVNPPFVSTQAHALLWDGVTLAGDGVVSKSIPIQLALDGFAVSSDGSATSLATFTYRVYDFDFGKQILSGTVYALGGTTVNAMIPGGDARLYNGPRHLQISYELTTNSDAYFDTVGAHQTGANFYNTLHFRWSLPQGAALAGSNSGFFNPGPVQGVPEPASLAALAIGAAGLLRRARRGR